MNDIKINYTAFLINDWKVIIEKHLFIMKNCGLYNRCTQFNIYAFPKNDELIQLLEKYDMTQKTRIISLSENNYEFPAIRDLIDNPMDVNLYFHTKGVSQKQNSKVYIPSLLWNDYMTFFNIYHYNECLKMLNNSDVCGVELFIPQSQNEKLQYSGNFWWATKNHLNKLRNSQHYLKFIEYGNRYDCENIIGSITGRYAELFNSGTNTRKTGFLYFNSFLNYDLDIKKFKIHVQKYD